MPQATVMSVYTEMTDTTITPVATPTNKSPLAGRPLRIVIPGGEGHLGRLLLQRVLASGHTVTTLSCRPGQPETDKTPWARIHWDGRELGPWTEALEDTDVVINLAGRTVDCRYNAKNRAEILCSRVESTAVLGRAIQALRLPPRLWLNSSTATIYRHSFDRAMDEVWGELGGSEADAPDTWRFSIDVAGKWEDSFFGCSTPYTRKVALRTAMVMSSDPRGVFAMVLRLVRLGLGGAWGSGRQYMSWIHELDFLRAVEFLIEREDISGVVNLAAPNPLPNKQFLDELREAWGIRFGLPAHDWMLSVGAVLMRTETELLLKSRRVVPGVLSRNGFAFRFQAWAEAAQDLVRRWRVKGSPPMGREIGWESSGERK
jgi:uncharacterized protein